MAPTPSFRFLALAAASALMLITVALSMRDFLFAGLGAYAPGFVFAAPNLTAPALPPPSPMYRPVPVLELGPRPFYLVADMAPGPLKTELETCADNITAYRPSRFVLGHRGGGTLQIPEHSRESNLAGARMGAGVLECDVTFTADRELVCRHAQCDLHSTTNIVAVPALNAKCTQPFQPARPGDGRPASARCCASDITLAEFKSLCGKMEGTNDSAVTPEAYLAGTPGWRTDLYSSCAATMSLREHIALVDALGLDFTPELKEPEVAMPFGPGYTDEAYAQQMIDAFRDAGVAPSRVWPQSFRLRDVLYWLRAEPEFGRQAVLLDESGDSPQTYPGAVANLTAFARAGVRVIAPPMPYLVALAEGPPAGRDRRTMVPSEYAIRARELGLEIVTWTLERSGRLSDAAERGGYYFESVREAIRRDGDVYEVLDVLARQVGVRAIFTDWAATATFYANCVGIFP